MNTTTGVVKMDTTQLKLLIATNALSAHDVNRAAERANDKDVWIAAVGTGKVVVPKMLEVGHQFNEKDLWEAIAKQLNLGNKTRAELLDLGKQTANHHFWKLIFETGTLDDKEIFDACVEAKDYRVWISFVCTVKLMDGMLTEVAVAAKDSRVWKMVIGLIDFSVFTIEGIFAINADAKGFHVLTSIIEKGQLSDDYMLAIAKWDNDDEAWLACIKQFNLGDKTGDKLIALVNQADNRIFSKAAIETGLLSDKQLMDVLNKFDDEEVCLACIKQFNLGDKTGDELTAFGNQTDNPIFWKAAAETGRLSDKQLIEALKKAKSDAVTKVVVDLFNFGNKNQLELFAAGEEADNPLFYIAIAKTGKLTLRQLIKIAKKTNDDAVRKVVIEMLDLGNKSSEKLTEIGVESESLPIMKAILDTKKLSAEQLVVIWEKTRNKEFLKLIVASGMLSDKQLIEAANKAKDDEVSKIVIEYLNLGNKTQDELLEMMKMAESPLILEAIFATRKITGEQMIVFWKKTGNKDVLKLIVASGMLSDKQLIEVSNETKDDEVSKIVIRHLNLGNKTQDELLEMMKIAESLLILEAIFATKKITGEQMIVFWKKTRNKDVLKLIVAPDILTEDELKEIGKEANDGDVWEIIFRTHKLSISTMFDVSIKLPQYKILLRVMTEKAMKERR